MAPGRLIGIPMISLYNIKNGVKELERCKKAGLVGCLIWQVRENVIKLYDLKIDGINN